MLDNIETEWYIDTQQNYIVPTDLFRYCAPNPLLYGIFNNITWLQRILTEDPSTGRKSIKTTNNIEGLRGRLPVKLFESLTDTESLQSVFADSHFYPFYGLRGTNVNSLQRGVMYPIDLFKYNTQLSSVKEIFAGTNIPVGIDVNQDLFKNNTRLRDVSYAWFNVGFDERPYNTDSINVSKYPQVDFDNIFISNIRITNAAYLFAVASITNVDKGLRLINDGLLRNALNIENISSMFYYNQRMSGNVPTFNSSIYSALNTYEGYLQGTNRGNITNSDLLEPRLIPSNW